MSLGHGARAPISLPLALRVVATFFSLCPLVALGAPAEPPPSSPPAAAAASGTTPAPGPAVIPPNGSSGAKPPADPTVIPPADSSTRSPSGNAAPSTDGALPANVAAPAATPLGAAAAPTAEPAPRWPIPGLVFELVPAAPAAAVPLTAPEHAGTVPIPASLVIRADGALRTVRVRLFDEAEKLVPSDDEARTGAAFRYELRPVEPLVAGTRYELRIDGDAGHGPAAPSGLRYLPASVSFTTEGEKPPPPAPKKRRSGRRR